MLKGTTKVLNIQNICIDAGTQVRSAIDEQVVMDYAESMKEGAIFPAIEVVFDGVENYLTDGFHRYHAHLKNGKTSIEAFVINGTLRDAKLLSYRANTMHGLTLSAADKRKAVLAMLDDMEYCEWSNKAIARHCNVSGAWVGRLRTELENPKPKTTAKTSPKTSDKPLKEEPKADLPPEKITEPADTRENDALVMLSEENETLTQRLAVAAMDATDDEKAMASTLIADYIEQIRLLKIDLVAVKSSRDQYQNENAELKKQVAALQRQLKKQS
jgi:ParB-like chromosome segregation protein Spo0J